MDARAIEKAESRLRVAQKAAGALPNCKNFQDFTDNWYSFLTAAKNVWTVLENGSKATAQSRQWFGAKKNDRRGDELLQYLFEARNDDEHGLSQVAEHSPPRFEGRGSVYIRKAVISNGELTHFEGGPVTPGSSLTWVPARFRLAEICARGGRKLPPPTQHLGQPLADQSPHAVAGVALAYLSAMVEEARSRA